MEITKGFSLFKPAGFLVLFITFCEGSLVAQPAPIERTYEKHYMTWFSLNLENHISRNFRAGVNILHWRQQVEDGSPVIFRAYQMQSFYTWLYYDLNENFTFALSPFAYLHEIAFADDAWEFLGEPQYEYIFSARILNKNQYGRLNMTNRFSFEYRHRTTERLKGEFWPEYRLRYQLRFSAPLSTDMDLILRNEIYIAFGRYIQYNLLDQNIAFLGARINFSDKVSLTIGYSWYFEPLRSGDEFNIVHALNVGVNFSDLIPLQEK